MDKNERTRDVYEEIPEYPKPPLIPISDPDDLSELCEAYGIKSHPAAIRIVKTALSVTGLKKFHKNLRYKFESIARKTNTRTPGLFSPAISATLALRDDERNPDPVERAATLIYSAQSLYNDIVSGRLKPDSLKGQILEMGEYPNLFSTNLTVENGKARVFKSTRNSHIITAVGGRFYSLNLGDPKTPVPFRQLYSTIEQIVSDNKGKKTDSLSAGTLTAASDRTQLKAFNELAKDPLNKDVLDEFRHSFTTVCLDLDSFPETYSEAARLAHSGNYFNRWYHSSLQIVVFGNSKACVICNFTTYLDGNVMMRAGAELQSRAEKQSVTASKPFEFYDLLHVKKLELKADGKYIIRARMDLKMIEDDQQATFELKDIGTKFFKTYALNPVPAFITALQMAVNNLTGQTVSILQFLSMSKYRCMDLARVKVTTPEVIKYIDYLKGKNIDPEKAKLLLREAVDSQMERCRKARRHYKLPDSLTFFMRTGNTFRRLYFSAVISSVFILLRVFKLMDHKKNSHWIIVSHPEIYPEVKVVGRPGIRLPYAKDFGLHYQILEDKTVITFMPGVGLKMTNEQITSEIIKCIQKIRSIEESSTVQIQTEV